MRDLVKMYRWLSYDAGSDRKVPATHSGTLEAIREAGGTPTMSSEREIDASWLDVKGFFCPLPSSAPQFIENDQPASRGGPFSLYSLK